MKTKTVKASELSTKSLLARDYVLKPYLVTYREVVERDVLVHLRADTAEEAQELLDELSDSDLIATLQRNGKAKLKDMRCIDRQVFDVKARP